MAAARQVTTLQGTAPELIAQLSSLRSQDTTNDAARQRFGCLGGAGIIIGIAGGFFSLLMAAERGAVGLLGLVVAALLLAGGIYCTVRWNQLRTVDLDSPRLDLVQELLVALGQDLSDKKPLTLTLAHGDCFQFGRVTDQRSEGTWMTGKVDISAREDTWLELGGRLQDGSVFKLSVTESGKRKSKPKRKYTKIQDRIKEEVSVLLRVSPEVYPHLDKLQNTVHPDRLQGNTYLHLDRLQVEGGVVRLRAETGLYVRRILRSSRPETGQENRLTAAKLVSLLAFLYAGLSHCRAGAEGTPTAPLGPAPAV